MRMAGQSGGSIRQRDNGHRKRLKQKFLTAGMEAFHEYEVLEFLLTYAIPQQDVKPQAKDSSEGVRFA